MQLKTALIQLNATEDTKENINKAISLCNKAAKKANFILLPEVFTFRKTTPKSTLPKEPIPNETTNTFSQLAKRSKTWILLGSLYEKDKNKCYNTSILINPKGEIQAKYQKMHLFNLKHNKTIIDESKEFIAGKTPTMTKINEFNIGLSICYDLRFPELYRFYSAQNAHILTCPASFTKPTGLHWDTLLKARAIENQCYILAPNQYGVGAGKIETYGKSKIIDPWGNILKEASTDQTEILYETLKMETILKIRKKLPALNHKILL